MLAGIPSVEAKLLVQRQLVRRQGRGCFRWCWGRLAGCLLRRYLSCRRGVNRQRLGSGRVGRRGLASRLQHHWCNRRSSCRRGCRNRGRRFFCFSHGVVSMLLGRLAGRGRR